MRTFFVRGLTLRPRAYAGGIGEGWNMGLLFTLLRASVVIVIPITAAVCLSEAAWERRRRLRK